MKPFHWYLASVFAFLTLVMTLLSFTSTYVYPRTEGEKVERRIELLERIHREDLDAIRKELYRLNEWLRQSNK